MKKLMGLGLSFLLAAAAAAAPPDAPEKVEAKVGELTRFVVKAEKGKKVAFAPAFEDGACFLDQLFSNNPDQLRFLVQPRRPGEYWITFWTVGEADYKQVKIVVPGAAPPPGPAPGPSPPPGPTDPFVAAIRAGIGREPVTSWALIPKLADVYEFGAARVGEKSGDGQAYLADTWGALFEAMAKKADDTDVAGRLPAVNAAVAPEVRRLFPVKDTDPISAADRARAGAEFRRVAAAIREAAK